MTQHQLEARLPLPVMPAVAEPEVPAQQEVADHPIFVDERGHRRRWLRVGALAAVMGSAAYVGALVLVLHGAPEVPDAHVDGVASEVGVVSTDLGAQGAPDGDRG